MPVNKEVVRVQINLLAVCKPVYSRFKKANV